MTLAPKYLKLTYPETLLFYIIFLVILQLSSCQTFLIISTCLIYQLNNIYLLLSTNALAHFYLLLLFSRLLPFHIFLVASQYNFLE